MSIYIPTLTEQGYVNDPSQKLNKLVSYFLESNASQSSLYPTGVSSLAMILAKNTSTPTTIPTDVITTLTPYLESCFSSVEVLSNVKETINDGASTGRYVLYLDITCTIEDGTSISLQRSKGLDNSLSKVIEEINEGTF